MVEFKKVELSDKEWVEELLEKSDYRGAEYNFTNIFIWGDLFKSEIARYKDFFLYRSGKPGERVYLYPPGRGNRREVIELLMDDAERDGSPFKIISLTKETKKELNELFPSKFKFKRDRDSFDYIYEVDRMVSLAGRKLQSKRNHANYFKRNSLWSVEPLTPKKVAEVKDFSHEWCRRYDCDKIDSLELESCAVERCLKNYEELKVVGEILRVDREIVGYTIGEVLNSDTVIIHVEKAFHDVRGSYQFLNQHFISTIGKGYRYVNREDDAGDSGLRAAKKSYNPIFMLEKYSAKLI